MQAAPNSLSFRSVFSLNYDLLLYWVNLEKDILEMVSGSAKIWGDSGAIL